MAELKGIDYLRKKLDDKRVRALTRYKYYEQKNMKMDPGQVIPFDLQNAYRSSLGWISKSVDTLADRLVLDGFRKDNFNIGEIYRRNNADILFDSAILGALITSCDFIYISPDEDGFPRLQTIDGANATGEIDPITYLLNEGYAVLQRDKNDNAVIEAYFTPEYTDIIYKEYRTVITERYVNPAGRVLLVPIIYKPDAKRPFGHSRISRACMDIVDKARNTVTRGEVSAEFYSFPQKYVTGMSPDAEPLDKWKATISTLLQFDKDEDGDHPILGQFNQQTMAPFIEQIKMYAALFGGETGLTLEDLGFASGNPTSSEAIKAAHENLRLTARAAQRSFNIGFINAGFVAACLRDKIAYNRSDIYETEPIWRPTFEADAAALSGLGDALNKIEQSFPGHITEDKMVELIGI